MTNQPVRVYIGRSGIVAHELAFGRSPNSSDPALCGISPWPDYWHGTGSQEEQEKAARLRMCARCLQRKGR